jgi:O-antigen ligase
MGYFIISQNPERFKRLMMAFFVFSALVLLESYRVFFVNGLATISDILNTNYLVTGQTLGTGLLVLIPYSYFALTLRNHEEKRGAIPPLWFWLLFLSSLFFYVLINLGGRGPVIATSAALTVFYGAILYGTKHRQGLPSNARHLVGIHFCALVFLCTLSYVMLNGLFEHTSSHFQQRVAPLLAGQIDEAVNERFTYYQSSFESFLDHPFLGVGFGGWPVSHSLGDVSLHPHNIFLEILSETGLIGFTLFMVFLYCIFRNFNVVFMVSTPERLSLGLLTIFSFINSQKTGDLHDNLLLFVTLSLCAGIKNWKNDHVHRPLRI